MFVNKAAVAEVFKGFQTIFNQSIEALPVYWKNIAGEIQSSGASEDYKWLEGVPMPREWKGPRQVVGLSGKHYEVYNTTFEDTIGISVDDIEDDKLGMHKPRVQELAEFAGGYHIDALVFAALAAAFTAAGPDGAAFISAAHPRNGLANQSNLIGSGSSDPWFVIDATHAIKPINYQNRAWDGLVNKTQVNDDNVFLDNQALFGTRARRAVAYGRWQYVVGCKTPLNTTNFALAIDAPLSFTDVNGTPMPSTENKNKILVIHPSLVSAARVLIDSEHDSVGASNPFYKMMPYITVPWLAYTPRV
jgi:phage major head subunit gpT-like protein